ncbi:plant basic secretory protein [Suillus decipiens]|nr:plant basic secretory protein [Suillus decipiens]
MPPHDLLPQSTWIIPSFVLRVEDLSHPGASIFFDCVKPKEALKLAVEASYTWLYTPLTAPTHVKTITLVLRPFDGVAYTFGTHETKEINFSLDWIKSSEARAQDEILGVLVHEVVHCYQYNAKDTCPGGLIEGIADFVRLHAGFAPPHWRPRAAEKWDAGYDATAYFLDWIERRCGEGTIRRLNGSMKDSKYGVELFEKVTGESVSSLYALYCEHLEQTRKIPHA